MNIQKITAGANENDPLASTGAQVAAAVNGLVDVSRRVVTPYEYGLTDTSTTVEATAAFQSMFDSNTVDTEFLFRGDITLSSLTVTNKQRCTLNFLNAALRFTSATTCFSFDEIQNSKLMIGSVLPSGARSGTDVGIKFVGLVECVIDVVQVGAFTKPVQINPIGAGGGRIIDGFYYNDLTIHECGSETVSTTAIEITTTNGSSSPGYVNENDLHLKNIKALGTAVKFIKGVGQTDPFNGNTFYKLGLERVVDVGVDLAFCVGNSFIYPRFESQFMVGRFNTALIRDASDCSQNHYILATARNDKLLITSSNNVVTGVLTDSSQARLANKRYTATAGTGVCYAADGANFAFSTAQNLTEAINGNVLATDNNKPYAKYLRYVKGADGVVRGAGLVQPYAENLISSWTNGQVIEAGLSSFIRIAGGTSGNVLNLKMHVDREIGGFSCLVEIQALATEVNVQNSAGTQQIALTAFQTGGDARGLFALVYRDGGWRVSQLGGTLKNA